MNRFLLALAPLISVSSLAFAQRVAPPATQPDEQIILATGSQWRAYGLCGPGQIATEFAAGTRIDLDGILGKVPRTSPPPDNWAGQPFDRLRAVSGVEPPPDAGPAASCWTRSPGPIHGLPHGCQTLYLRGLFAVTDPARVQRLTLFAAYRGGIVVYLNGREVARKDLPSDRLAPDTPALPFPVEAYLDSAGEAREQHLIDAAIRKGDKDLAARVATRDRTIGPAELPIDGLRQGTNILAIEIHRSGYRPEVAKWSKREQAAWPHLRWTALRLTAAGDGIRPNVARPARLGVWNRDIHDVFSTDDYGDPNEPPAVIRMVGPRKGCCSGQVVVGSPQAALDNLRAACGDLVRQDGQAKILAAQVRTFFPGLTTIEYSIRLDGIDIPKYLPVPAFGALLDHPPDKIAVAAMKTDAKERAALGLPATIVPAAVQPVWITVRIPKDAAPGLYRGTLDLSSAGNVLAGAEKVPVELEVVDWVMPEPKDAGTTMALNQSPETLAMQYGVEQWSDRHWQLMEKSYQLLGQARNNLLIIPLVCRTQYGNDDCYLPWVRQADGAGQPYRFDFTVHDRLIELAKKYCDLRVISYQVYLSNGWNIVGPDKPTFVTVVDPASGKRERMQLPAYGSEESRRLFKPLIEQIKQHLAKLGVGEGTRIVLGVCQDAGIHKTVVEQFKLLWPEAAWHYGSHNRPSGYRSLAKMFGYSEYLYVQPIPPTSAGRRYGWKDAPLTVMSQRIYGVKQVPLIVRTMPERALVRGDNGAGRMCLDYWPVMPDKQGRKSWLYDRWPDSTCDQRSPCLRCLAQPGPDGPVASSKLAVLREGLQEAEARIGLERALADKRITGPGAEKVQALLDRRVEELRAFDYLWPNGTLVDVRTSYSVGWQASSAELLKAAAEIARTPGGK